MSLENVNCSASTLEVVKMIKWMRDKWITYASGKGITIEVSLLKFYRVSGGGGETYITAELMNAIDEYNQRISE